jgi:hypothetical protein
MAEYKPAEWEAKFLELYKATCNVSLAARGAKITRDAVYKRRDRSSTFAALMDEAEQEAIEYLEAEAWSRAKKTSDTLMIFLLKAHKPAKYFDRIKIEGGLDIGLINQAIRVLQQSGADPAKTFEEIIKAALNVDAGTEDS